MSGHPFELTVLDACSDLASWTKVAANQPDITTANEYAILPGGGAFRFQADADGASPTAQITKAIAHSFKQDDRLGMLVYSPNRPNGTTSGFTAFGGTTANLSGGNRWRRDFGAGTVSAERQGWQLIPFEFAETTIDGGTLPTQSLDYAGLRLRIQASTTLPREFYVAGVVKWKSRPTLIIQFDDGVDSSYTEGFAYANPRGVPLTHYVIPGALDVAGRLTRAQVLEMHAAGDEIGSHGSGTDAWEVDPQDIVGDTLALRDYLGLPMLHGAYPNGAYGRAAGTYAAVQAKCAEAGLVTCRTVEPAMLFPGAYSSYTLPTSINLQTGVTLDNAKTVINRCIKYRMTGVIIAHILEAAAAASTWAIADWQALIDYVVALKKQGLIETMTMSQWHSGNSRPAASRPAV